MSDGSRADEGDEVLDLLKRSGILASVADRESVAALTRDVSAAVGMRGGPPDGDAMLVHSHYLYLHESHPTGSS